MRHLTELDLNGEYTKGQDDLFVSQWTSKPSPDERGLTGKTYRFVMYISFEALAQKRLYM